MRVLVVLAVVAALAGLAAASSLSPAQDDTKSKRTLHFFVNNVRERLLMQESTALSQYQIDRAQCQAQIGSMHSANITKSQQFAFNAKMIADHKDTMAAHEQQARDSQVQSDELARELKRIQDQLDVDTEARANSLKGAEERIGEAKKVLEALVDMLKRLDTVKCELFGTAHKAGVADTASSFLEEMARLGAGLRNPRLSSLLELTATMGHAAMASEDGDAGGEQQEEANPALNTVLPGGTVPLPPPPPPNEAPGIDHRVEACERRVRTLKKLLQLAEVEVQNYETEIKTDEEMEQQVFNKMVAETKSANDQRQHDITVHQTGRQALLEKNRVIGEALEHVESSQATLKEELANLKQELDAVVSQCRSKQEMFAKESSERHHQLTLLDDIHGIVKNGVQSASAGGSEEHFNHLLAGPDAENTPEVVVKKPHVPQISNLPPAQEHQHAEQKPAEQKPAEQKPAEQKPAEHQHSEEKPAAQEHQQHAEQHHSS